MQGLVQMVRRHAQLITPLCLATQAREATQCNPLPVSRILPEISPRRVEKDEEVLSEGIEIAPWEPSYTYMYPWPSHLYKSSRA